MDEKQMKSGARILFLLCFIVYTASYVGRKVYSACLPDIMPDLGIDKDFGGYIATGFLAVYGTGQLISGIIGDKVSPKQMLFIGLLGQGVTVFLMGAANNKTLMLILWCLSGAFASMLWAPLIRALADWLPKSKQSAAGMNIAATIPVGQVLSYLITGTTLKFSGWHLSFYLCGAILVVCSLIWFLGTGRIKPYLNDITAYKQIHDAAQENTRHKKESAPNKKISLASCIFACGLLCAVGAIFPNGALINGIGEWVPTYITDTFSVEASKASLVSTIMPIIGLSGAYIAGIIDRKYTKNEYASSAVMFAAAFVSLGCLVLFGHKNMYVAIVLIAISNSSMLGANNMILTFMPLRFGKVGRASSVTGFLDACSYAASALSTAVFGVLAQSGGWARTTTIWAIIAAVGLALCLAGVRPWKKGIQRLEAE